MNEGPTLGTEEHECANVSGQALYEARFTPAWPEYPERLHLMALPGEIRNSIYSYIYILPIDSSAMAKDRWKNVNANAEDRRQIVNLNDRTWDGHYAGVVPAVLHACRQLRYEFGAWYCRSITVHCTIPLNLDSSRVTYFTQFVASAGCPEYRLVASVGNNRTRSAPFGRPNALWAPHPVDCWPSLKLWARDIFTGVETRVLSEQSAADDNVVIVNEGDRSWADMAVDDNAPFVLKLLHVARLAKFEGTSWSALHRTLRHMWKSYVIWNSNDFLE